MLIRNRVRFEKISLDSFRLIPQLAKQLPIISLIGWNDFDFRQAAASAKPTMVPVRCQVCTMVVKRLSSECVPMPNTCIAALIHWISHLLTHAHHPLFETWLGQSSRRLVSSMILQSEQRHSDLKSKVPTTIICQWLRRSVCSLFVKQDGSIVMLLWKRSWNCTFRFQIHSILYA